WRTGRKRALLSPRGGQSVNSSHATIRRAPRRLLPFVLALAMLPGPPARAAEEPREIIKQLTDAALAVLGDKSLSTDDKRHRLEDIVYAHVDFDIMARLVLARNWSRFSPAQQAEFVKQFKEHLSMTYGRNIENYRNERVEIVGDQKEARGDWTVNTKIRRGSGVEDILVDYRLREENGAWRIIDIVIERVSLVANFRSQLQEVVNQ